MLHTVALRTPIFLLPGKKLQEGIAKQRDDCPKLPTGLDQILTDLAARRDGVPATFVEWKGSRTGYSLQLHTYSYILKLLPSNQGDGYLVTWAAPMLLGDHDRLARACLLIRTAWHAVLDLRHIPQGASAGWDELFKAWRKLNDDLGDSIGVPALKPEHGRFLDTLTKLNEAEQRINARNSENLPTFPYRAVEVTDVRRDTAAAKYVFHIAGDATPERNAYIQLRGTDQRGQVIRIADGEVTVRFDHEVDWASLPQQGELLLSPTDVVYLKRREAIGMLRSRQARNPALLDVLVDHRVQPIDPVTATPEEELDPDQLVAFRKSLGVRDLMVVLGPPGTGKTRTISQIARSHAFGGARDSVLIASHTNRAVDNVLAKLPRDVTVVRVGNEGKIDPDVKPLLLENLAADLREEVIGKTGVALKQYAGVPYAADWYPELARRIVQLDKTLAAERAWYTEWSDRRRAAGGPAQQQVDDLTAGIAELDRKAVGVQGKVERLEQKAHKRGLFARWRARRLTKARATLASLGEAAALSRQGLVGAEATLDAVTRDVPAVREARGRLEELARQSTDHRAEAVHAASMIVATVGPLLALPPVQDNGNTAATRDVLAGFHQQAGPRLALLAARARILTEWQQDVSGATEQLYPELIRYADVVGATCIGSASRSEIANEEFDLAVVDEAGQIATLDVLVPLVRARRAVLVGDDRQLPPVVTSEVLAAVGTADPAAPTLLRRSALENLVEWISGSHVEMLTQQRRMPKVIADFISDAFYQGRLQTMVTREHDDVLFACALAFVDTADLPEPKRRERTAGKGTQNVAEAHLLARLAAHYQRRGQEWALIVPYAAQRKLVVEYVLEYIPDQDLAQANIGTVDSFQGGERDVILYGFTRSNRDARVGFLEELRRANVAFTRAKHQLVLVGDLETLVRARDDGFRTLMGKLHRHVLDHGDLRHSRDVWHRLEEPAR